MRRIPFTTSTYERIIVMPVNVLFICLGNICRSPTAEAIFRNRSLAAGLDINIDSAGTGAWHTSEPPDRRAQASGRDRGYSFDGQTARKICLDDFEKYDHILAMDRKNLKELTAICPAAHRHKLELFLDYAPHQPEREVPDPYYGGDAGFDHVIDLVEAASNGLIAALKK